MALTRHDSARDGVDMAEETLISNSLSEARRIHLALIHEIGGHPEHIQAARGVIEQIERTSFFGRLGRAQDQITLVDTLQRIAYHETDSIGVQDIAQWCVRRWLQMLQTDPDNLETLRGETIPFLPPKNGPKTWDRSRPSMVESGSKHACKNPPSRRQQFVEQRKQRQTRQHQRTVVVHTERRGSRGGTSKARSGQSRSHGRLRRSTRYAPASNGVSLTRCSHCKG